MTTTGERAPRRPRAGRLRPPALMLVVIPALLFAVPWWVLVAGGQGWPGPVFAAATVLCAAGAVA
ncbi:MAG: metallophosphoesterase, partial [Pseudonocardia sp.]